VYKADYRKPAIAVIAGQTVERAARHSKVCRPIGVTDTNCMGVGNGKSMQMLNFEENGSIFCEWCLPQTSVRSEETLQRAQWRGGAG
jgi:hypothetical protein